MHIILILHKILLYGESEGIKTDNNDMRYEYYSTTLGTWVVKESKPIATTHHEFHEHQMIVFNQITTSSHVV